jgi:hypothetical protein
LLDQAYTLEPSPVTLFQLAKVEHQLGRCREAKRTTQRVLAVAAGGSLHEQARQLLANLGHCD